MCLSVVSLCVGMFVCSFVSLLFCLFFYGAEEGSIKYGNICRVADGLLYCSPFNASSVLVMDPCARTLRFIEGAEEGGLKYFGICAGPDGMLYCAATAASSVLAALTSPT